MKLVLRLIGEAVGVASILSGFDPVGHAGWIQGSVRLARPNRWRSIGLLYSWLAFATFGTLTPF